MSAHMLLIGLYTACSMPAHGLPDGTGSAERLGHLSGFVVADLSSPKLASGPLATFEEEPQLGLPQPGAPMKGEPARPDSDPVSLPEQPTPADARWVGFTPAVFSGTDLHSGAWMRGPVDRKERAGWITDVRTGATTRVRFLWQANDGKSRTAILSRQAATELGLQKGEVTNLAVYLTR